AEPGQDPDPGPASGLGRGGRILARLPHRMAHGGDAGRRAAGRDSPRLGDRGRGVLGRDAGRQALRRSDDRDVLERGEARPGDEARRRYRPRPCETKRGEGGARLDRSSRSEEHTSELQSPCNLVCRLLLEKKKKKKIKNKQIKKKYKKKKKLLS